MDAILTTLVSANIAAIVWLAKMVVKAKAASDIKHEQCEKEGAEQTARISTLERNLAVFASCANADCGARAALVRSNSFIESVNSHPTHTQTH